MSTNLVVDLYADKLNGPANVSDEASVRDPSMDRMAFKVLDAIPMGVALLSREGAVVAANRMAKSIIHAGDGIRIANQVLRLERCRPDRTLREMLATTIDPNRTAQDNAIVVSVQREGGKRPIGLLLAALANDEDFVDGFADGAVALLYLSDPDYDRSFDHKRIATLYGLSRAESRVAALLASGYRLEETAALLGIAYETARKHIKNIFSKTGTDRQAELVYMLVTGPAGLMI